MLQDWDRIIQMLMPMLIQMKVMQDEFGLEVELVVIATAFVDEAEGEAAVPLAVVLVVHPPNHVVVVVVEVENYPIGHEKEEEEKVVAHPKHLAWVQHKTLVVDVAVLHHDDGAVVGVGVVDFVE